MAKLMIPAKLLEYHEDGWNKFDVYEQWSDRGRTYEEQVGIKIATVTVKRDEDLDVTYAEVDVPNWDYPNQHFIIVPDQGRDNGNEEVS